MYVSEPKVLTHQQYNYNQTCVPAFYVWAVVFVCIVNELTYYCFLEFTFLSICLFKCTHVALKSKLSQMFKILLKQCGLSYKASYDSGTLLSSG